MLGLQGTQLGAQDAGQAVLAGPHQLWVSAASTSLFASPGATLWTASLSLCLISFLQGTCIPPVS